MKHAYLFILQAIHFHEYFNLLQENVCIRLNIFQIIKVCLNLLAEEKNYAQRLDFSTKLNIIYIV